MGPHEVEERFGLLERFAIDADVVGGGIGFAAEFGDDGPIDGDAAGGEEFFGFAARGDAGSG